MRLDGGLNPYCYVDNNPVGWIDVLGVTPNLPKAQGQELLYRGDTRSPEVIFSEGFRPLGKNTDLLAHAWDNKNPPSIYVSTSISFEEATKFGTQFGFKGGNIYTIRGVKGIDVNKTLGSSSPYPGEKEIAVFGNIDPKKILGVTPVNPDGSLVGYTLLNPQVYLVPK